MRVLVIGAQEGSLGQAVAVALRNDGHFTMTAGVSGEEGHHLDVCGPMPEIRRTLAQTQPDHVIVTAGTNVPDPGNVEDPFYWYSVHMNVNAIGPMRVLQAWLDLLGQQESGQAIRHFVAVGSNSSSVPRSGSAAYCASKAALAQAIRCKARELQGGDSSGVIAYGYEPGLLAGTPMTAQTADNWPGVPLTRMRGERLLNGIPVGALATMMVAGLYTGAALNGCMVPFDAGER